MDELEINSLKDYKYLISLDTETTGLNPKTCSIIELAFEVYENIDNKFKLIDSTDCFVKLNDGEKLPKEIIELTGITDEVLENEGISKLDAALKLLNYFKRDGKKLFIAYNAKFDKDFVAYHLYNLKKENLIDYDFKDIDFLDVMTIYKDRAPFPSKLNSAIIHYNLQDKVKNSHRAIDDTNASTCVLYQMALENDDIDKYINLFGYNPKYILNISKNDKVTYKPQSFISEFERSKGKKVKPLYEN